MTLESRIIAEIREKGAITVARYMELVLGDPEGGYYMTKDPLGLTGDFVTSPEISQVFGELCGIWAAEAWSNQHLGEADLVEFGPGRGTLMADALRATKRVGGFHDHLNVQMVEMSPVLRTAQQRSLYGKHPRVSWHSELPDSDRPLLVLANEFFDALPIHQYVAGEDGWHERLVTLPKRGDGLVFTKSRDAIPLLPYLLAKDSIVETCPLAVRIMEGIATRIAKHGGAALIIDYGYMRLHGVQASGSTLQAVRGHQYHDVLQNPGKADVTAHVDFSALADASKRAGARAANILSQREFLQRMGGKMRVDQLVLHAESLSVKDNIKAGFQRLIGQDAMGELFLVLAVTPEGVQAPVF